MRLLVCGGAGFIGSTFVRRRLAQTSDEIVVLDKLTYAGNRLNLAEVETDEVLGRRMSFVHGDIADERTVRPLVEGVDAVVNFAAESHVDRSILDAGAFLRTGVLGVHVLLEAVREFQASHPIRFVQVSTDEVYGDVEEGRSRESDALSPRSPYAAAKAAGELLVRAYHITHGIDAVITRGANTYGPFQHLEKVIPLFITNALSDTELPLYGDGLQERDWLHVDDHADGVGFVLDHGESGAAYNIAAGQANLNRDVTARILELTGRPWSLVRTVPDRPGHDRRYAMDGELLGQLGWRPSISFDDGLPATVRWFIDNEGWWQALRSGDWEDYYERQYGWRLSASRPAPDGATRIAVSGAGGRLGQALLAGLAERSIDAVAWSRPAYDLDDLAAARQLFERDRPTTVIHAAAWTDVDGCARDPGLAIRRNAEAVGELAEACAANGARLVLISTNEVFDGTRSDGHGYSESDPPHPINPYGQSKHAGEIKAAEAFNRAGRQDALLIARTAWLFGPPGNDFPAKIIAAADGLPPAQALDVVVDEVGSPTYSVDLAQAIISLISQGAPGGTYHLVNQGRASRLELARQVLARCRPGRTVKAISRAEFARTSTAPAWAVLDNACAAALGIGLRPWQQAVEAYASDLRST